jgi:hypothetical protein
MEGFTFYRSYMETAQAIPDPTARLEFLEAVLAFTLDGTEPEFTEPFAKVAFSGVRPNLQKSRTKSDARKIKSNQNSNLISKTENQNESKSKTDLSIKPKPVTDTVTVTDTDINTNVDQPQASGHEYLATEFEELWKLYPRKDGKKAAFAAYVRARTRKKDPVKKVDVYMGIVNYNAMIKASGTPAQYIMQGSTFFRGERWTDDFSHRPRDADRNKFNQGMESHDYDFDALEKELLGYDLNTGGTA